METKSAFRDTPLTIAEIRDSLRHNAYVGDLFEALRFLLQEYDTVNERLKTYTRPTEYTFQTSKRIDVV